MEKGAGWGGGSLQTADTFPVLGGREATTGNASAVRRLGGEGVGAILLGPSCYRITETGISFGRVGLTTCMRLNLTYRTLKLPYLDKSLK